MAQPFSRTLRSLERDGIAGTLAGLALAATLLTAWTAWFFSARLSVVAVSEEARLEVETAAHPVAATENARLTAVRVALGEEVVAGQALFELDTGAAVERLAAEHQRLEALTESRSALDAEIRSTGELREAAGRSLTAAIDEAAARQREARAAARQADADRARLEQLNASGLASEAEVEQARSLAEQRWAAVEALEVGGIRDRADHAQRDHELLARLDRLRQERAGLDEQMAAVRSTAAQLESELDRRTVQAPVAGRIAQLADVRPGSVVPAGRTLATVVPAGRPRAVAFFSPADALGRIHPGQSARLRLSGFPTTQYGSLPATVREVASELDAGRVRVELELGDEGGTLPVSHGLPGVAEVEVERAAPSTLLLRAAGRAIDGGSGGVKG